MKLDLELLAPYLPYGLKFFIPHDDYQEIQTLTGLSKEDGIQTDYDKVDEQGTVGNLWSFTGERNYEFYRIKPILRPLSDLKRVGSDIINEHSINILISEKHNIDYGIFSHFAGHLDLELDGDHMLRYDADKSISFQVFFDIQNEILKGHYDVFGLIEKNLAIDKNTLDDKIEK